MTEKRWNFAIVDAYTDEYVSEEDFGTFEAAAAWAAERKLDPEQFTVLMYDGIGSNLLRLPA